jgi:hypothetical protein
VLRDCLGEDAPEQDLLANALSLCCAGAIMPADRPVAVDRVNQVLLDHLDPATGTTLRVLPWGTALRFDGVILIALRDGRPTPERLRPWTDFLKQIG